MNNKTLFSQDTKFLELWKLYTKGIKEILHMQQSEIYGIRIKIVYQEKKLKVCIKIFRN